MSDSLGVADLKRRFSEILNRVELRGERIAVLRHGRTVAVIGPAGGDDDGLDLSTNPRRGLTAAAGAWEEHPDIDAFIAGIRAARDSSADREVEAMK